MAVCLPPLLLPLSHQPSSSAHFHGLCPLRGRRCPLTLLVLLQLNLTDLSTSSSLLENSLPLVVEDAVLSWFSFIYLSVLPPLLC